MTAQVAFVEQASGRLLDVSMLHEVPRVDDYVSAHQADGTAQTYRVVDVIWNTGRERPDGVPDATCEITPAPMRAKIGGR